jgi:glycosyltransferase involved in cell wall biosynthesis
VRIAIIASPFVPVPPVKYGGTELVIHNLIKGLLETGHEPVLVGTADSKVGCEIVPLAEKAIYFARTAAELPAHQKLVDKIYKTAEKTIRQLLPRVDILHSHGYDLKNFNDVPNVTTIHGPILFEEIPYYAEREDLYYVSISKNQQEAYPPLKYVGVVYNGGDPKQFPIVRNPEDYVCFIGRFDREKNPHLAIKLAINLGIRIKLAGKIDHLSEGYFDEEVKPYLDHPLVEYLGEIDFKSKVDLQSKAKCNLHPTGFREPFGLTVLEAAYSGTPTLAIERGSMPELIEEGRTGMLVEDFIEGYHQIQQCFDMDRNYIASRARMLFNYQNMTKHYVEAYEKVLDIFKENSPARIRRSKTAPKTRLN